MYRYLVRHCWYVPNAIKLVIGETNASKRINTIVMRKDKEKILINQSIKYHQLKNPIKFQNQHKIYQNPDTHFISKNNNKMMSHFNIFVLSFNFNKSQNLKYLMKNLLKCNLSSSKFPSNSKNRIKWHNTKIQLKSYSKIKQI